MEGLFGAQPKARAGWLKRLGLVRATLWVDFAVIVDPHWSTMIASFPCVALFLIRLLPPTNNRGFLLNPKETYALNLSAFTLSIWSFRTPTAIVWTKYSFCFCHLLFRFHPLLQPTATQIQTTTRTCHSNISRVGFFFVLFCFFVFVIFCFFSLPSCNSLQHKYWQRHAPATATSPVLASVSLPPLQHLQDYFVDENSGHDSLKNPQRKRPISQPARQQKILSKQQTGNHCHSL